MIDEVKAIPATSVQARQDDLDLGQEVKRTNHVILEAFDKEKKGIEALHQDLFDGDPEVVLSALSTLGKLRDQRSLKFISRLLTHQDEAIKCAAAKALGDIGHPLAAKLLSDLFKISKNERLRCIILEAMSKISPEDPDLLIRIREFSTARIASRTARAFAVALLCKLQKGINVEAILRGAKDEVIEAVYKSAESNKEIAVQVVQHGLSCYNRLSAKNRSLLASVAVALDIQGSIRILLEALNDADPEVRAAAYRVVGQSTGHIERSSDVIRHLSEHAELIPALEEEAINAIQRLEQCLVENEGLDPKIREKVYAQIQDLFKILRTPDRKVGSESHELGWLMARSKEYLEYYADEEFRQSLLHYIKGSSSCDQQRLLMALKSSAVKVEVRHFDGYRALADIIKNPKRHGIALIARELAIAKLGKRELFYRLIRNLRLTRLFSTPALKVDAVRLFQQVFSWAKQEKVYRLAEAALYALTKVDIRLATDACRECLTAPVFSKICAIAGIRMLKELDWGEMEPTVLKLLESSEESYVVLNLIDALSSIEFPASDELIKSMVNILLSEKDREISCRTADFLGSQSDFNVFENITEGFEKAEAWRQSLILSILERKILAQRISNREGLIEFLYKILRMEGNSCQSQAAVLLWRLGDDYAAKVLKEFVQNQCLDEKINIVRGLKGALSAEIIPILSPLLPLKNTHLQESLRETLLSADEGSIQSKICEMSLALREGDFLESRFVENREESEVQIDFLKEKNAYKFEREYIQELAILFSDIQGYSKKAQTLSTMQLTSLIQDYEGILLPTVSSHGGELIKKMGDGHLFVFRSPLSSVLSAIRLQKALKRFNSYRERDRRLIIRIGIHWGKVVRKEGDVLGNHVNIASRLENSAKGGSILISEALFQFTGSYIHTREIGLINVKGIAEPIKVYEPYEIVIDFPEELDPLKMKNTDPSRDHEQQAEKRENECQQKRVLFQDKEILSYILETFSSLNNLCRRAELNQAEVGDIRKELSKRWSELRTALKRGMER